MTDGFLIGGKNTRNYKNVIWRQSAKENIHSLIILTRLLIFNLFLILIKSSGALIRVSWLKITDISRDHLWPHHQGCDVTMTHTHTHTRTHTQGPWNTLLISFSVSIQWWLGYRLDYRRSIPSLGSFFPLRLALESTHRTTIRWVAGVDVSSFFQFHFTLFPPFWLILFRIYSLRFLFTIPNFFFLLLSE
jgi:hypothetical protein